MRDSPREIQHEVEKLKEQAGSSADDVDDVSVAWREAAPDERPTGIEFDADASVIHYDLWGAQFDTLDVLGTDGVDIVGFLAGYGSGKTIFGARWLIAQALANPSSRFLGMGIDFMKARDSTFRVLFEQLPGERTGVVTSSFNGPETSPVVEDYDRKHHRLTFVNDTVVKLGSADRWNRYAGDEYGGVWLDEPSHYGEDLHDLLEMIGGRLRGVDGPKVQLWTLTGNGYNSAWRILEEREDSNGDPIGLEIDMVRASTLENPYLDESDKDRFERQYGGTARETQALHGGFAAASGNSLRRDQLAFIHAPDVPDVPMSWYVGVDVGVVGDTDAAESSDSDYTAATVLAVNPNQGQGYLVDAIRTRGKTLRETVAWLQQVVSEFPNPTVNVESVHAQRWLSQELTRAGLSVNPVNPTEKKEHRIADMSILFENEEILLVNHGTQEDGVDDRWRDFIREWTQFGSDGRGNTHDDLLDAAWLSLDSVSFGGIQVESGEAYGDRRRR